MIYAQVLASALKIQQVEKRKAKLAPKESFSPLALAPVCST